MLNTKQVVTCLLAMALAMALASPLYAADANVGTPENPNCTASGKPVIPRQFYLDLQRDLAWEEKLGLNPWDQELDDVDQEKFRQQGGDKEFHPSGPKFERRAEFQHRLMQWRIDHNLPATIDCTAVPLSMTVPSSARAIAPTAAAVPGITTVPQHSVANNIFRKQKVVVDIYDAGNPDGDIVDVYLNNAFVARVTLQPYWLATNLLLTLKPSDTLATKTNVLKFVGISSGTDSFGAITIGLKGHDGQIFPGSAIAVNGGSDATVGVGGQAKANLALGLACIDPVAYPQSAIHIQDAQKLGFARIMSPDRANADKRRAKNTRDWKAANPTAVAKCVANSLINPLHEACDVDEYPNAMFLENQAALPGGGKPHMRAIPFRDNRGSGGIIGKYASRTLYLEADPTSPIFARHTPDNLEIIVPTPGGKLFCKNAF